MRERSAWTRRYGVIFLATLESILSKPAQAALTAQGEAREYHYTPQVNQVASYVTVLEHSTQLLNDPRRSPASTLAAIECWLNCAPMPDNKYIDTVVRSAPIVVGTKFVGEVLVA